MEKFTAYMKPSIIAKSPLDRQNICIRERRGWGGGERDWGSAPQFEKNPFGKCGGQRFSSCQESVWNLWANLKRDVSWPLSSRCIQVKLGPCSSWPRISPPPRAKVTGNDLVEARRVMGEGRRQIQAKIWEMTIGGNQGNEKTNYQFKSSLKRLKKRHSYLFWCLLEAAEKHMKYLWLCEKVLS